MTNDQLTFFGDAQDRLPPPAEKPLDYVGHARACLTDLLARLRSAERMPLSDRELRSWGTVLPNMVKWLPLEEAEQVRSEYAFHLGRLKRAV